MDRLWGEFVDVIEWTDDSDDTLVWRFPRYNNEIKNGAKLTVRPSQAAVFVNEGQVADVFQPGMYELTTANLPILSTLKGWRHGFQSPFKAEVYFVSLRRFTDLKWGTRNPIMLRDPEFGPVRLRAFGTYEVRVSDPAELIREVAGTDGHFTTDEITDQLRNLIVSRFAGVLGGSGIPILDLAASYDKLGEFVAGRITPEFTNYGIELVKLLVENVSLPPAVEQALDRRTSMGVVGDLSRYTQFQAAEAMRAAASNPGGDGASGVGAGMGLGMGMAMAKHLTGAFGQQSGGDKASTSNSPATPPPIPQQVAYHVAKEGQATGPFKLDDLREQVASGQLSRSALVWKEGMPGWVSAGEVPELSGLFRNVPPPIPS